MSDDDRFARSHSLKSEIYARHSAEIEGHRTNSASYARLAVQSAYVLNGGALLAVPAYIAALHGNSEAVPSSVATAFAFFVLGVVSAAICSYVAYINYDANAVMIEEKRDLDILQVDEEYDTDSYYRMKEPREQYRAKMNHHHSRTQRAAYWTLWAGQITGIGSYLFFCAGCWFATSAMLGSN